MQIAIFGQYAPEFSWTFYFCYVGFVLCVLLVILFFVDRANRLKK